ncbi:MAG: exo-alpha-sialidase [Kiritimatiellae bacterium]|nr:exo-alpha-sialidase [Kiritimatiellia bacterium]
MISSQKDGQRSGFFPPIGQYAPNTRYHEGIPSLAASPSGGRLWATWYASATGCEVADNYLILSTSADDGATWREVLVYDPDPNGPVRAFDPELWVAPDGLMRWSWTERTCQPAADPGDKYAGCHSDPSCDRLMMAELDPDAEPDAAAMADSCGVRQIARGVMMCKPTVLSDGTWLLPVAHWKEAPSACVVASTDGGKTFAGRGGATLPESERTFDEHQIVELADGRLRLYIRTAKGPHALWEAESADGGRTWTAPRPSALPHTSSRFFVRRLSSGNLLMVKNGLPGEPGSARRDMTAYLSGDDGATWPWALPLDTGREKVSYPDGQQLPDGRIAVVYDCDRTGARQILFACFREEDIKEGRFLSADSHAMRTVHSKNDSSDTQ